MDERLRDQALDRLWNEIVASPGEPVIRRDGVDPADEQVIRQFQSRASLTPPDAVRERVRRGVLSSFDQHYPGQESVMNQTVALDVAGPATGPNGRTNAPPYALPPFELPRRRFNAAIARAAAAVLIILTIVSGFFVYTGDDRPAVNPPLVPSATPAAPGSADVPMYRGNAARTGEMTGPGPLAEPVELWRFQTQGEIHSAPAIVDGVLYAGSGDDHLYALDAATGDEIWRFPAGGSVGSSPAVVDGIVYVGSAAEILYAVDAASGTEVWQAPAAGDTAPAVLDGVVYAGGVDGAIIALDAKTGDEVWRTMLAESASRSVSAGEGFVYVGTSDGVFHALDLTTGEERWSLATGFEQVVTPTVKDGTVYIVGRMGDQSEAILFAAGAADGEERWRYAIPSGRGMAPVAVTGGLVVISANVEDYIAAVDADNGEERWNFDPGMDTGIDAALAVTADTVYAAAQDGNLYAIDLETGFERWRYTVGASMDFGPTVSGGVLYVGAFDGVIYAFGDSGGAASLSLPATSDGATPEATAVASPAVTFIGEVGPAVAEFVWSASGGPDGLNQPCDIAFAPDGRIWVTDGSGRIHIFEPDGTFVEAWGEPGTGPGQFDFAEPDGDIFGGIAFGTDGRVFVADTGNRRVQVFDADRNLIDTWGGFGSDLDLFEMPLTITAGQDEMLYVLDFHRGPSDEVKVFTPEGELVQSIAVDHGGGSNPVANDLFVDGEGNVYVARHSPGAVLKFDPDGNLVATFGADAFPDSSDGVAVDEAGRIYATGGSDDGRIVVFAPDGTHLGSWGSTGTGAGQFAHPYIVTPDGEGNVYVTDGEGNTLQKFRLLPPIAPAAANSFAEFVWSATGGPGGLLDPVDIAFAPDGRIWVNDGTGRFHIFEADGTFVEAWGEPGTGEGQFDFRDPDRNVYGGIAFTPDGGFLVADTGNRRVQRFDVDRKFVEAWGGFGGDLDLFGMPLTITAGPDGAFYVLDERPDRVLVFDLDGTLLRSFPVHANADVANEVNDLFVGGDGTVYVASTAPPAVLTFDPSGQPLATIGEDEFQDQVASVAADAAGRIYALETPSGDRVLVFEADGTFTGSWGTSGAGEGQFESPVILALDSAGHAYVTDIESNTLQKFRLLPPYGPEI